MAGQLAWAKTNNLRRELDHGGRSCIAGEFVRVATADCGEASYGVWKWHEYFNVSGMRITLGSLD